MSKRKIENPNGAGVAPNRTSRRNMIRRFGGRELRKLVFGTWRRGLFDG